MTRPIPKCKACCAPMTWSRMAGTGFTSGPWRCTWACETTQKAELGKAKAAKLLAQRIVGWNLLSELRWGVEAAALDDSDADPSE